MRGSSYAASSDGSPFAPQARRAYSVAARRTSGGSSTSDAILSETCPPLALSCSSHRCPVVRCREVAFAVARPDPDTQRALHGAPVFAAERLTPVRCELLAGRFDHP